MRRCLLLAFLGSACAGDPAPAGDETTGSTDAGDTSSADDGSTSAPGSDSGPMFTTAFDSSSSDGSGDTAGGTAEVVFTMGEQFDFLFEDIGMTDINTLELLNIGTADATGMAPAAPLEAPFSFTGGAYPGDLGNCTGTLATGEMCTVHIQFTPTHLAVVTEELSLGYLGGLATITLVAEGRGTTPNLVEDGDFEACSASQAPTDWDQGTAPHWACTSTVGMVDPHGGTSMASVFEPTGAPFEMTYAIDLGGHTTIADGLVTGELSVWTYAPDGDEFEVELSYLDGAGTMVGGYASGTLPAADWTETSDSAIVPEDAVSAELTIRCVPAMSDCSLHVDDVTYVLMR